MNKIEIDNTINLKAYHLNTPMKDTTKNIKRANPRIYIN